MSPPVIGAVGIAALLLLLFLRIPVWAALTLVGFVGNLALSGVRGGLAIATIAASACFGAVCGSSIVTAATMTRIALPEMRKAGYDDRLATGSLAAGGSIGILIPPSIILVIYASIAEQSVPKLFAAALLPGMILTALYMAVAVGIAIAYPHYAPNTP